MQRDLFALAFCSLNLGYKRGQLSQICGYINNNSDVNTNLNNYKTSREKLSEQGKCE